MDRVVYKFFNTWGYQFTGGFITVHYYKRLRPQKVFQAGKSVHNWVFSLVFGYYQHPCPGAFNSFFEEQLCRYVCVGGEGRGDFYKCRKMWNPLSVSKASA